MNGPRGLLAAAQMHPTLFPQNRVLQTIHLVEVVGRVGLFILVDFLAALW